MSIKHKWLFSWLMRLAWVFIYIGSLSNASAALVNYTATNDSTNVYYTLGYTGTYNYYHVYIDTDQNITTGYQTVGVGANYLVENGGLYRYTGTGTNWSWALVKAITYSNSNGLAKWTIARADIGETANPNTANLIFQLNAGSLVENSIQYTHTYTGNTSTATINYTVDSTTIFPNPERGFYHYIGGCVPGNCNIDLATLQSYRNENITLVMYGVDLGAFASSNISQAVLNSFNNDLALMRQAGLKVIIRFGYSWDYPACY